MTTGSAHDRTHYEVLGVPVTSSTDEIRRAYRVLAREHHPDRHLGHTTAPMIRINEAWRVLSDPQRRRNYDAGLEGRKSDAPDPRPPTWSASPTVPAPARFPWKFVLGFFVAATIVILIIGAFGGPGGTPPIDNIIRVGSCVDVDRRIREAREVSCDGPHDAQVVQIVPFDGTCPTSTTTYRDKQGLGLVCATT